MSLTLTSTQADNASSDATRPVFVVELQYAGGSELLSSSGRVVYDDRTYEPGVRVASISNTRSASLDLPWTPERVARVASGAYQGHLCRVWYIPAALDDGNEFEDADGLLLMDGLVRSSSFASSRVSIDVLHVAAREILTPRITLDQVTPFAAAAGQQIEWDGEIITLESRR